MTCLSEKINEIKDFAEFMKGKQSFLYSLKYNIECLEDMFKTLSKFQPGDRVKIAVDLELTLENGWYPYRFDLEKGRTGTIVEIFWSPMRHRFEYLMKVDKSFWVDREGQVQSVKPNSMRSNIPCYSLSADKLVKIENENKA